MLQKLFSRSFLVLLWYFFSYSILHLHLLWCLIPIVVFLLFLHPNAFLIWQFYSFHCFSFHIFHCGHCKLFNVRCHSYILTVYFNCLHQGLQFFFRTSSLFFLSFLNAQNKNCPLNDTLIRRYIHHMRTYLIQVILMVAFNILFVTCRFFRQRLL